MLVIRKNPFVEGETNTWEIDVTEKQMQEWWDGALIQDAMPNLTADEREFIKTGITPETWEKTFGTE